MAIDREQQVTRILTKLREPTPEVELEIGRPFLDVLEEFAAALNKNDSIEASIEPMSHPNLHSLVIYPKFRRDTRNNMLTFLITEGAATLLSELGSEEGKYGSPEELWTFLLSFLQNSGFGATLQYYQEATQQPVDGFMRVSDPKSPSREDAAVVVAADQQRILGTAPEGTKVTIQVEPQLFPFTSEYTEGRRYDWLVSSGYVMRIDRIEGTVNGLSVSGTSMGQLDRLQ